MWTRLQWGYVIVWRNRLPSREHCLLRVEDGATPRGYIHVVNMPPAGGKLSSYLKIFPQILHDQPRAAHVTVTRHEGKQLKCTEREKKEETQPFVSLYFFPVSFCAVKLLNIHSQLQQTRLFRKTNQFFWVSVRTTLHHTHISFYFSTSLLWLPKTFLLSNQRHYECKKR